MDSGIDRLVCGREEDLVSFLYGELDEAEAQSFRIHTNDCKSCSAEVTALGSIRQSVIAWRNESLGAQARGSIDHTSYVQVPRRSASAAIREFFNLSPVWMKAAVGFASVLFCIFAVLAASGLRKTPSPVATKVDSKPSTEEINATVERQVKDELARLNSQRQVATANTEDIRPAASTLNRRNNRVTNRSQQDARRPLTRVEREQLAADLRLIPRTNDIELELLDDAINQ